jgi:predicted nucleic acid-binding protein
MADSSGGASNPSATPSAPSLRILLDTNVVLDVVLAREPWAGQAKPIFDAGDAGRLFIYLPASVLTDIYYICRKQVGAQRARATVEVCLQRYTLIPVDHALLEAALRLPGPDFEDNVQVACVQAAGLDLVVTRNTADFAYSPIPAVEPHALAGRLAAP